MGIPFVTPFGKISDVIGSIDILSEFCTMPLVASSDHRIVSKILAANNVKLTDILYYGNNESTTDAAKNEGNLIDTDPISHILQPVKVRFK